jgi:hypothetical protein
MDCAAVEQCAAVCGSVRQCAAVCGSVRQCAAVFGSVRQCERQFVAMFIRCLNILTVVNIQTELIMYSILIYSMR